MVPFGARAVTAHVTFMYIDLIVCLYFLKQLAEFKFVLMATV